MKLSDWQFFTISWRPSLLQQFIVSFILALLPVSLIIGLFLNDLDRHMDITQKTVTRSSQLESQFTNVVEDTRSLERAIRQNWLLNNEPLQKMIRTHWQQVDLSLKDLETALKGEVKGELWSQLLAELQKINEEVLIKQRQDSSLFIRLHRLLKSAQVWLVEWKENNLLQRRTSLNLLQEKFIRLLLAIIPLSLLLSGYFIWAISRRLRLLSHTIEKLGRGDWRQAIVIKGSGELVELGARMEWMRCQLKLLQQQKDSFLRHVSHELKTPLASLVEGTALLKEQIVGPMTDQQLEILELLQQNNERLGSMIDGLLNYNRSKRQVAPVAPVDFLLLEKKIRQHFSLKLEETQQKLEWRNRGDLSGIFLEPTQLEVILVQLISNGSKFSPPNTRLNVKIKSGNEQFFMSVCDQGPGIDSNEVDRIFDAFYQGSLGKNNRQKGHGLGLALVNECVQQLGGEITYKNLVRSGCCFLIKIPLNLEE